VGGGAFIGNAREDSCMAFKYRW